MFASRRSSSMGAVPNMGYAYPEGTPEIFQGIHEGLAKNKVACNDETTLSLWVVHEGENVFQ